MNNPIFAADNNDEPSLEFDIDAILASNPNPLDDAKPVAAMPPTAPPAAAPAPPPPVTYPDLITADLLLDDQRTISTLGRDQSLLTRDDPPIAMFRPSFDPDRFADEEIPSLPKNSYKPTRNNQSPEAMRKLNPFGGGAEDNPSLKSGGSRASDQSVSYRDLYTVVIVLALLLLAIITGLAIWLIALKTNQTLEGGGSSIAQEEEIWTPPSLSPTRIPTRFDIVATTLPTAAPTRVATLKPSTSNPTRAPTSNPTRAPKTSSPTSMPVTDTPTARPTPAPTLRQTHAPTPLPTPESKLVQKAREKFLQVLQSQSRSMEITTLQIRDSPQYHALDWLIHDPNFEEYSNARLIQRWVLASFAFGLKDADWRDTALSRSVHPALPQALMDSWVQYDTDECTWFFTQVDQAQLCNEDGLYQRIDLRSQNLSGTLPMEIALLSNHLGRFHTRWEGE